MANGLIGSLVLPDATENLVATVTSFCYDALIDINVLNPTAGDITVWIAICDDGATSTTADDYIEKGGVAGANGGSIAHNQVLVKAGSKIYVKGSALGLVAQVRAKARTKR